MAAVDKYTSSAVLPCLCCAHGEFRMKSQTSIYCDRTIGIHSLVDKQI